MTQLPTTMSEPANPLQTYLRVSGSPWLRWAARILDISLFGLVIFTFVPVPTDDSWRRLLQAGVLLLWVPLDAVFIATTSSSPGKWLFGLSVRHFDGSRLRFETAFTRAGNVFVRGLGVGIFAFLTMPWAFWNLINHGTTSWDRECEAAVYYRPRSWRMALGVVVLLLVWRMLTDTEQIG